MNHQPKHKYARAIAKGVFVISLMGMPVSAYATDEIQPSIGSQTGSGSTEVTVQTKIADIEVGGNTDPNNPGQDPNDPNSPGSNIAFTVPSAINFVSDAQGNLTGPSASVSYIENLSVFSIHVSSFDVDPGEGWNIIDNGSAASAANSVDFQFGPSEGLVDAYDYLRKTTIVAKDGAVKAAKWNMAASGGNHEGKLPFTSTGNLFRVDKDITTKSKIATIKTYVKQGPQEV